MGTRHVINLSGAGWRMWRDDKASWKFDRLHLPPVNIIDLPVRPPTGGWEQIDEHGRDVAIPGTVEEHCWDEIGDYCGVSWWRRRFVIDEDLADRRVVLQFDAVRLRAEVFLDRELVGYDLIGNTPFEVDLTGMVRSGVEHELAVRVTDPGGHFSWEDFDAERWGRYTLPASHGFGGVTGDVRLVVSDRVYVEDIFVRNNPTLTDVDLEVALCNLTNVSSQQRLRVEIVEARNPDAVLYNETTPAFNISPGERVVTLAVSAPQAKLWSPEAPNLYRCRITLTDGDAHEVRFGFRWFCVDRDASRAVFRLNGKRVVIRTAISWSFWPTNGVTPSHEYALKQVRMAKRLGLNTLSFHRCIGQPAVFEQADELGLMIYEEPGGYTAHGGDEFCFAWAREKLLRMILRDRNHPSLVIYNMINEEERNPRERHIQDMRTAHRLDPTRPITYTSGWNSPGEDQKKLHMLPYDDRQYIVGWTDYHHAPGPGVYRDEFYKNPDDYRLHTDNRAEIVYWGEEGAIGTPPRLERIHRALEHLPNGWDGAHYRKWHDAYLRYLDDKRLRDHFPTVDALTKSLGNIAFYYQGRIIENARIGDNADGYAVNGWESTCEENHSGIVDCFRNPKGDPKLLAYYNQPLYVAIKLRRKIAQTPVAVLADFFIVNEMNLAGSHTLRAWLEDPMGNPHWFQDYPVTVTGGDRFGELLVDAVEIAADVRHGMYVLRAELRDQHGKTRASGHDLLLVVDWRSIELPASGAVLDNGVALRAFLETSKNLRLPDYEPDMPPVDYVLVGDENPRPRSPIPPRVFSTTDGASGLTVDIFQGVQFDKLIKTRVDAEILVTKTDDGASKPFVPGLNTASKDFSARWTGRVTPPETGEYVFHAEADDGFRLWIDGQPIIDEWTDYAWWHGKRPLLLHGAPVTLEGGRTYELKAEFYQIAGEGGLRLWWTTPGARARMDALAKSLTQRVHDGATVVILKHADQWADVLGRLGVVKHCGRMHGKRNWLGSNYFVRQHPLFAGLPTNEAMNWPYQEFAEYDADRFALLLDDEDAVVGFVSDHQHQVGTAVGVVRHGAGRFVFSTLEILPRLNLERHACDVVRKTLCNYIAYAANPRD